MQTLAPTALAKVPLKPFHYRVQVTEEGFVFGQVVQGALFQATEHEHGIVIALFPELSVEALEKLDGLGVPGPPEVVGQSSQTL